MSKASAFSPGGFPEPEVYGEGRFSGPLLPSRELCIPWGLSSDALSRRRERLEEDEENHRAKNCHDDT